MKRSFLFLVFICLVQLNFTLASHIVGYDMYMINIKDTGGNPTNFYKFKLKFYRDVTGIPMPSTFYFTIAKNGTNTQVGNNIPLNKINPQTFVVVSPDGCASIGYNTTIELGIYESPTFDMSTYNNAAGYYVFANHYARDPGIKNVQGPSDQYTLLMTMDFPALNTSSTTKYNSSPVINKLPPTFFCLQVPVNLSINATDPDGDSLVFSLVQPLDNSTTKPFNTIPFNTNYGFNLNVLDGNPDISINRANGNISFTPTQLGKYLIAYKCEEYRNSVKIGEIRRELQIEIVPCQEAVPIVSDITNNTFNLTNDTIAFTTDTTYKHTFRVSDVYNDSLFLRVIPDTGSANLFDTTQFTNMWFFNDSLSIPFNSNGLTTKGKAAYNLDFYWDIDSTDIKKTPYRFRLIVNDDACPKPLSDTLDVELLITGQCYQNVNYNLEGCDSLVDSKGRVFYNDSVTIDTVLSIIGCDNIITQNIKINKSSLITYITSSSCDSILAIDGKFYHTDTTVSNTYQNSTNCDSIVSQHLIIKKSITLPIRGSNQIVDTNLNYYYAVDSLVNLNYNWEIINGQIVSGKNTNLVEVKWYGSGNLKCYTYYDSSCVKSSSYDVSTFVGIENELYSMVNIYPNPTNGKLIIERYTSVEDEKIYIYDLHGRLLLEKYIGEKTELDISEFESGVYMIRVNNYNYKLLKL